jgi:hypothetical protein
VQGAALGREIVLELDQDDGCCLRVQDVFLRFLRKMFFFEKKNQKTFISPLRPRSRPGPGSCRERRT